MIVNKVKTNFLAIYFYLFACIFASEAFAGEQIKDGIKIVASIKPLALLIQEIATGEDSVDVLLERNQDHHTIQVNPSQRSKVAQANVVFYIDDDFEFFVKKIKASDDSKYKYIKMSDTQNLRLLSVRKSGELPHLAHEYNPREHVHSSIDLHFWLNPDNAIVMLRKIRDELTKLKPENQVIYQERYEIFSQHLIKYSSEKAKMMMEVLNSPFFVLHDGFQYFEEQYGLEAKGIILQDGQIMPSARHLNELRKVRLDKNVNIILKEEQYSDRAIDGLAGNNAFKVINVDSLAQGSLGYVEDYISYTDAITEIIFKGLEKNSTKK